MTTAVLRMATSWTRGRAVARLALAGASLALAGMAAANEPAPASGIALVIGNDRYEHIPPLANPVQDARAMAALLRDFGFRVYDGYDLDRQGFEALMRTALLNADPDEEVLFFFAGHGIQIGQRNYLLPVDARFESVNDLPRFSITLDRVVEVLAAQSSAHVAIIDACRENPFPAQMLAVGLDASLFEARDGFGVLPTPLNSLLAFSASPGALALDGEEGGHSPFTDALLDAARSRPTENLPNLLSDVRQSVFAATAGFQVPWESSTLVRPFVLQRASATVATDVPVAAAPEPEPAPEPQPEQVAEPEPEPQPEQAAEPTPEPQPEEVAEPAPEAAPAEPLALTVAARFDRRVAVSDPIAEAIGQPLSDVTVLSAPTRGRIDFAPEGEAPATTRGLVVLNVAQSMQLRGGQMVFRPSLSEVNTAGSDSLAIQDVFRLAVEEEGRTRTVNVSLELEVDPCDREAGDALDLQGVGFYRWPNEIEPAAALAACADAVAARPDVVRFVYQYGRAQLANRDFEGAHRSFRAAADAGHIRALNALAALLTAPQIDRELVAVPLDPEQAAQLRERGIAAGDPFAMHSHGLRLLRDGTTRAERERGFELLDRAAEMGHTFSMNELGAQFLREDGDFFQPQRALAYLETSSARNDIYGHHNLGIVALQGLDGNPPDFDRARDFFERAAAGGHPSSPGSLGRMYARGQLGGAPDLAAALDWFDEALVRGDAVSGLNAAEIALSGAVPGRGPADGAVRAAKVLEMPTAQGVERAAEQLGRVDDRARDMATQMLLVELGERIAVDGAVGPATRAALQRQAEAHGVTGPTDTPETRLLLAARAFWAANPLRPDLF